MITDGQLYGVSRWLAANQGNANRDQALRAAFPDLHFTFCLDDDVVFDAPAFEGGGFNLYLVDSSSHCLAVTDDKRTATGVVVAELDAE